MGLLYSPSEFSEGHCSSLEASYTYTAQCLQTGGVWQLPRTHAIEAIARGLMQQLMAAPDYPQAGSLYGVLLVQTMTGDRAVLKGFSGMSAGQSQGPGWVPLLTAQAHRALVDAETLTTLDQLKDKLIRLKQLPVRTAHKQISQQYATQLQQLKATHRQRKERRDHTRNHYSSTCQGEALTKALNSLKRESQQDSSERRRLKHQRDQALAPLAHEIAQADRQIQTLRQQYAALSLQWRIQMQSAYAADQGRELGPQGVGSLPQGGRNVSLEQLGQRAAAKLLYYAAIHHLKPLAMAEFWWGQAKENYSPGQFYGASPKDCQTLMHLAQMSDFSQPTVSVTPLSILYQDEALIVVDKPPGLLSVPGRRHHLQDSVLSRLSCQLPNGAYLQAVHRLDQATSGILILALSPDVHRGLSQQFAQRHVCKTYEAILSGPIAAVAGTIELPLWSHPTERPRQSVHSEHGKPSVTHFQLLQAGERPRVRFVPHTGRTHQLRVHAAHAQGLNAPILGDSLYGHSNSTDRLHLHATSLELIHPTDQKRLRFTSDTPF